MSSMCRAAATCLCLLLACACLAVRPDEPRPLIDHGAAFHLCTVCVPAFTPMACCDPAELRCPACSFATRENDEGLALCCQTEAVRCGRCGNPMRVADCCEPDPEWIAEQRRKAKGKAKAGFG